MDQSISPPILSIYELAKVVSIVTEAVSRTQDGKLFGNLLTGDHPIIEAIRLIKERKIPFVISRVLLPEDPETVEFIDLQQMSVNDAYLDEMALYIKTNTIDTKLPAAEELSDLIDVFSHAQELVVASELTDKKEL